LVQVWMTVESIVTRLNQYPSLASKSPGGGGPESLYGSDSSDSTKRAASAAAAPPQLSDFEVLSLRHQNALEKVRSPIRSPPQ
jgi:hypothetical protein